MPGFSPRLVVLLLAGFLGGTAVGWISHRDLSPHTSALSGPPSTSSSSPGAGSAGQPGGPAAREVSKNVPRKTSGGTDPALPASLTKFSELVRGALKFADYTDRQIRLREIMRAIPVKDLPAAYLLAKKVEQSGDRAVLSALGSRWAESDPRAAAAFALKVGTDDSMFAQNYLLEGVIWKWAIIAPAEAVTWVEAAPPGTHRDSMVVNVIGVMAEKHPQAALQMLRRNATALNNWGNVVLNFFSTWAGRDSAGAAAGALQLNGRLEQEAVTGVAKTWAERDPRGALRWIDGLPKTFARQNLIETVGSEWADKDPRAELAWARGLKDDVSRRAATVSGISRLATADLGAALDLIQTLPAGEDHDQAIQAAAQSAAQNDVHGALQIIDQMSAGPTRNNLMQSLCSVWSESEPRVALDWLMQNAPAGKGNYGLDAMIQSWITRAPEDAIAWAEALPGGDRRDSVMSRIVSSFVETDLDRAQALFAQLSPAAQGNAASAIADAIFQESPEKARAWAQSLPEGAAQKSALGVLGNQWASEDPVAAAQWLGTLPVGKARDAAIASFSDSVFARDPEGALAWSRTISSPRDRDGSLEQLVRQWLRSDSTAARAWLDASTQIAPDEKNRILNGAPRYTYRYYGPFGFPF